MGVLFPEGGGGYFQIFIFGRYVLMVGQVGKGMLSEIVCKKFHSSFFRFVRTSWITFVRNNPLVIHSKNEFCGGDGFFGKKKIGGKFGLKMA